jgi:hypothetical protein
MRYVYDVFEFGDLTAYARDRLVDNAGRAFLAQFLPDRNVQSIEYRTINARRSNRAASVRAFDTPAQLTRRGTLRDVRGKLPPISTMLMLSESEQITLRTIYGGAQNADIAEVLEDAIFDDVDNVVTEVFNRTELLRGEVLATGTVLLPELQQEVDYGVDPLNIVAAPTPWTDPTSDKYAHLMSLQDRFVDSANGEEAGILIASRKVIQLMLTDPTIRALVGRKDAPVATLAEVNDAFVINGLPRVVRFDRRVEDANGVSQRIIPENTLVMLPAGGGEDGQAGSPIGETQHGITAEAGRFVRDGALAPEEAAGLVVGLLEEDNPATDFTIGTTVALPVLSRPEALVASTVF